MRSSFVFSVSAFISPNEFKNSSLIPNAVMLYMDQKQVSLVLVFGLSSFFTSAVGHNQGIIVTEVCNKKKTKNGRGLKFIYYRKN